MKKGSRVRIMGFIFDLHGQTATIKELSKAEKTAVLRVDSGLYVAVDTNAIKEIESDTVIGSCGLCNTASLNIYAIDDHGDTVKAGINDDKGKIYKLYSTNKGTYFNFGARYYLHEFMSV